MVVAEFAAALAFGVVYAVLCCVIEFVAFCTLCDFWWRCWGTDSVFVEGEKCDCFFEEVFVFCVDCDFNCSCCVSVFFILFAGVFVASCESVCVEDRDVVVCLYVFCNFFS